MSTDPFLSSLMGIVINVFDAYSAVLFLSEDDSETGPCRIAASFSLGDGLRRDAVITPGMGLVGWIIRDRKPLLISNFDQKRGVLGYYAGAEEDKIRAFMGCPLQGVGGALCLDSKKTYTFGEKDQKILSQFGALIGDHVAESRGAAEGVLTSRYYNCLRAVSGLRRSHPKWSAFQKALYGLLSETAGFRVCFLAVRDESGRGYYIEGANRSPLARSEDMGKRIPMGQGLIGWVFKHGAAVYSGERDAPTAASMPLFGPEIASGDYKSVVCLPIAFSKRTRGVLVLADETPGSLTGELKVFLTMIAEYLALFLENLHQRIRLAPSGS